MQDVIRIYTILGFFIYIILCSVLYMLVKDILEKRNEKKIKTLNETFGVEVRRQIEGIKLNNKLSKIDIDYTKSKISRTNYFIVFNEIITQLNKDEENKECTKKYVLYFEKEILSIVRKYGKKDDTKRTFIVNILGEYRLNTYEINEFLFSCLKSMFYILKKKF